jgi:hypothetical protein
MPDLRISDITFHPPSPTHGASVTISATVYNAGLTPAINFDVKFRDDYPDGSQHPLGTKHINWLSGRSYITKSVQLSSALYGEHDIRVTADSNGDVIEAYENNNVRVETLNVGCSHENHLFLGKYKEVTSANYGYADTSDWTVPVQSDATYKLAEKEAWVKTDITDGKGWAKAHVGWEFVVYDSTYKQDSDYARIKMEGDYKYYTAFEGSLGLINEDTGVFIRFYVHRVGDDPTTYYEIVEDEPGETRTVGPDSFEADIYSFRFYSGKTYRAFLYAKTLVDVDFIRLHLDVAHGDHWAGYDKIKFIW